jgi:hypothetical protein
MVPARDKTIQIRLLERAFRKRESRKRETKLLRKTDSILEMPFHLKKLMIRE